MFSPVLGYTTLIDCEADGSLSISASSQFQSAEYRLQPCLSHLLMPLDYTHGSNKLIFRLQKAQAEIIPIVFVYERLSPERRD